MRQGDVKGVGGRAHGEEEATRGQVLVDLDDHGLLLLGDLGVAEAVGHLLVLGLLFAVPSLIAVGAIELAVLAGEILVVQVQPIVVVECALEYFVVPDFFVVDLGVLQREGHRVVPRLFVGRRVHGDLRHLFQAHDFHVGCVDLRVDLGSLGLGDVLGADAAQDGFAGDEGVCFDEERAASVVEQPLDWNAALQGPESEAVGPQMVALGGVHGHEDPLGMGREKGEGAKG